MAETNGISIREAESHGDRITVTAAEIEAGDVLELEYVEALNGETVRAEVNRIDKPDTKTNVGIDIDLNIDQGELRGIWSRHQYVAYRPDTT